MRGIHTTASIAVAGLASAALLAVSAVPAFAVSATPKSCAQTNGRVTSIVIDGARTFIAGNFTSVTDPNGVARPRARLAAIDTDTCAVLSWNASANAEVEALRVDGGTLYAGGTFTTINGVTRNRLAALSTSDASLLSFNPNMNKTVRALTSTDSTLFVGGDFTAVGATTRKKLAAFSLSSGALVTGWKPGASGNVTTVTVSPNGERVYVGGNFTSLAGSSSAPYLGAVRSSDGTLDRAFLPGTPWPVISVAADSRGVYVGGGGSGGHLGIWELDGTLRRIYQTDGGVQAVVVDGDSLYGGGHFTNYCVGDTGSGSPFLCTKNLPRRKIFEIDLTTGDFTSWSPSLNSAHGVFALAVDPASHDLWAGGDFTKVGTKTVGHLAVFP